MGVWILIGVVWVALNPRMRGTKVFDHTVERREAVAVRDVAGAKREPGWR